jgi:2-oxoglutarate ferredoxin oxidoreductase subunit beta
VLRRAAAHRGASFVEIYQNCNIFNDGAFLALTSKEGRAKNRIYLEHGKPIAFGEGQGIRTTGLAKLEIVDETDEAKLLVHDEHRDDPGLAFALSRLADGPTGPTPLGIFRDVDRPVYGDGMEAQLRDAGTTQGPGDLSELLNSGDTWVVE